VGGSKRVVAGPGLFDSGMGQSGTTGGTVSEVDGGGRTISRVTGETVMANFFCAGSNQWVASSCSYTYPPKPSPPTKYPVFDPSIDTWISSGNYGAGVAVTKPYFSFLQNVWVT
jgi:hypothetical protein